MTEAQENVALRERLKQLEAEAKKMQDEQKLDAWPKLVGHLIAVEERLNQMKVRSRADAEAVALCHQIMKEMVMPLLRRGDEIPF